MPIPKPKPRLSKREREITIRAYETLSELGIRGEILQDAYVSFIVRGPSGVVINPPARHAMVLDGTQCGVVV